MSLVGIQTSWANLSVENLKTRVEVQFLATQLVDFLIAWHGLPKIGTFLPSQIKIKALILQIAIKRKVHVSKYS